jgi:putative transposase
LTAAWSYESEYDRALYHVTSRGNDRKAIFKDDSDRDLFLNILARVTERFHWICHGYCLMNNHYHLVIETPDGNLSKGMRQLNGVYTQAYNQRHHRVGHIFQGRFKAILVQKDSHFLEVCRLSGAQSGQSQSGQPSGAVEMEQLPSDGKEGTGSRLPHG